MPWPLADKADVVAVDTTWGRLQPLEAVPGVRTVGELELQDLVAQGARLVDSRVPGSFGGRSIPGATNIPHDQTADRRDELDPAQMTVLFCNGPQCAATPIAVRLLLAHGYAAEKLRYYRGGIHDWMTLGLPIQGSRATASDAAERVVG